MTFSSFCTFYEKSVIGHRTVDANAELTHVLMQDSPTSKSAQIQQRQWFAKNRLGQ